MKALTKFLSGARISPFILGALLAPGAAFGQDEVRTLKDVVQHAIDFNPEVQSKWRIYLGAEGEKGAAFGGFLPRVDVSLGSAQESRNDPTIQRDYRRTTRSLTFSQMLYDGFATSNEVKRLEHSRQVRLYELQDIADAIALEAVRAYIDVLRYRGLVALAEENYVRHKAVFDQIESKVKVGVSRRVDLEQASGRLALSEANLLTETSNLHDVSARFQRVVGRVPPKQLQEPSVSRFALALPEDSSGAVREALKKNPSLRAAALNVRAATAALDGRSAAYQPRLDLKVRRDNGDNLNGILGPYTQNVAEVVLSMNLFNGGSDTARSRQFAEQLNNAKEIRDKTCRDIRQTLLIAYNDMRKLWDQRDYLDQHRLSIEKARDAYRRQFDIGQRSLLDLLDTENELYQAKRAYLNAENDLVQAYARTHSGIGVLLDAVGVARRESAELAATAGTIDGDAPVNCPAEGPVLYVSDKAVLDERARELTKEMAQPAAAAAAGNPQAIAASAAADAAKRILADVEPAIKEWMSAWSRRDVDKYLGHYGAEFKPDEGTREEWIARRKRVLGAAKEIAVDVSDLSVAGVKEGRLVLQFRQNYRSNSFSDSTNKQLELQKLNGRWLIQRESVLKGPLGETSSATAAMPSQPVGARSAAPVSGSATLGTEKIQTGSGNSPTPDISIEVERAVKEWAANWAKRDVDGYLGFYASTFSPTEGSRDDWVSKRKKVLGAAKEIAVGVSEIRVTPLKPGAAAAQFRQEYRSSSYSDVVNKTLEMEKLNGKWLIVKEQTAALR